MKKIKHNNLANISVAGAPFNYLTFVDDIVTVRRTDEHILNFVNHIQNLEYVSDLRMCIDKTNILLTDEGLNIKEDVLDEELNILLTKFHFERCNKFFEVKASYDTYCRTTFCDGTRNRSRKKFLAMCQDKELLDQKQYILVNLVMVNGETIEPVKTYKHPGKDFSCSGISVNSIIPKPELCEDRLTKYCDILTTTIPWKGTKQNLPRVLALSPRLYSPFNWPKNDGINRKLYMLSRKINPLIEGIHLKDTKLQEGDLNIHEIFYELQNKYNTLKKVSG
eukprot:snap_masked-scaffold_5-processed-gene-14.23-mRNA-1 protein AED:1.00 eAED:1.00 QI:0/-1/0/0/-1/1/1/0/278